MKKSLIYGIGALAVSLLVGSSTLLSASLSQYKETKAETITTGLYLPRYNITDEFLGEGETENALNGSFRVSLNNGTTWNSSTYIAYNTRGSNYGLYLEDMYSNRYILLENGEWQYNTILLYFDSVASSTGDLGFIDYYLTNGTNGLNFTFNESFNYNAFAQNGSHILGNLVVREKSPFLGYGDVQTVILPVEYNIGFFKSAGFTFDTIIAKYEMATTDLIFNWQGGQSKSKLIDGANPYKFFSGMVYKNSITNDTLQVCTRNHYLDADSHTVINENVSWLSAEYRTITFYQNIDTQGYNYQLLSMANNNLIANGFNNVSDVGLGGAFGVLGLAFSSISGLLSIALFPGITLGFLLFLPLITGIIIAVIWVVKR